MAEILTEKRFIEECKKMSSQELLSYINGCLEKQFLWDQYFEQIPNELETYNALIQLLYKKLDAEVKAINEKEKTSEKNRSKHVWRIKNQCQQREAGVRGRILELNKSKELAFNQKDKIKDKIDDLIQILLREFNKINNAKITVKQLAIIIKKADEATILKIFDNPNKIVIGMFLELGNWSSLYAIEWFIDSLPSRKSQLVKKGYHTKPDIEKLKFFVDNFLLPPKTQIMDSSDEVPMIVENLYWKVLPAGKRRLEETINHFKGLAESGNWKKREYDESRLWQIEKSLKPNKCSIGNQGFEGYCVYSFNWTTKVILECPFYGNATYVIKDGWQGIAKLTKWEAKYIHSPQVTTINHNETWLKRLQDKLRSLY